MYSISVVIPTYNNRGLISRAIDSVLAQTYPAAEIVIVDDGSQDHTQDEVEARYGTRIRYFYQSNAGPSRARNTGIGLCTQEWIAFLDADDVWFPEKLAKQVETLRANPAAIMAVCDHVSVFPDGSPAGGSCLPKPLDAGAVREGLLSGTFFLLSGVLVRRRTLEESGRFDIHLRCGEDRDLWARLARRGPIVAVHEPLVRKLEIQGSVSSDPEATLRDGLVVNRRVIENLSDPREGSLSRSLRLRRINARLYWSVSWLYARRNQREKAVKSLARSWALWPWQGAATFRRQAGLLIRLLQARGPDTAGDLKKGA